MTLLNAISFEPESAAVVLTASSGALVPSATIVSPIMRPETLKRRASDALPSTNTSAPLTSAAKPTSKIRIFNTISSTSSRSHYIGYEKESHRG